MQGTCKDHLFLGNILGLNHCLLLNKNLIQYVKSESVSRSVVSDSLQPYGLSVACQAPLSMEFSGQVYCSGLPCPPPGDLPNPGIELRSPELWADSLSSEPPGKPNKICGNL